MDGEQLAAIAGILTALNLGPQAFKMYRNKSQKIVDKKVEAETTQIEIASLREVINTIRKEHFDSITSVKAENTDLRSRVTRLEERERHMLTRVAVHEAWDQIAFRMLIQSNPEHPPPPPLHDPEHLEQADREHLRRLGLSQDEE